MFRKKRKPEDESEEQVWGRFRRDDECTVVRSKGNTGSNKIL